jgi:hypothetical protein
MTSGSGSGTPQARSGLQGDPASVVGFSDLFNSSAEWSCRRRRLLPLFAQAGFVAVLVGDADGG